MKREIKIGDKGYFLTIGNVPIEIEVADFHPDGLWVKTQFGEITEAPFPPQAIIWDKDQAYQMCVDFVQADIEDYEDDIRACRYKLKRLEAWYKDEPLDGKKVIFGESMMKKQSQGDNQ